MVCGGGGRTIGHVPAATGVKVDDQTTVKSYHTFDKSANSFGYLYITVSAANLTIEVFTVTKNQKSLFDTITVNLT